MRGLTSAINWIKANKLTAVLLLLAAYLLFGRLLNNISGIRYQTLKTSSDYGNYGVSGLPSPVESAPRPDVQNRMVVQESALSLLVKDVRESLNQINQITTESGGYMVNTSLNRPQEAPYGTIVVRIPSDKLNETIDRFRGLAIKVVSENLTGRDVTDEYENIDERLKILERNKARLEEIMGKASAVEDLLNVQEKVFGLQSQIDNLTGRQKYLEQTAATARISIYLSTDELALPYSPAQSWRPQVIFKLAVRSLLTNLQRLGTLLIWLAVYAVVLVPAGLVGYLIYQRYYRRKP